MGKHLWIAVAAALSLVACGEKPAAPVAESPFKPTASLQEIMQSIVDPSADALWESVSSTTTASGSVDKQPASEQEWQELRHPAIRLAEAANLLAVEGRPVAHPGKQLEDAHVKGILGAGEIQAKIDGDRAAFIRHARNLQAAAEQTLAAIDAKNIERFLEAGGKLDQACEACHLQYWYPNDKRPTTPAASAAAGK